MLACNATEVLIASIAAGDAADPVGSDGVIMTHYSPFRVAETITKPEAPERRPSGAVAARVRASTPRPWER